MYAEFLGCQGGRDSYAGKVRIKGVGGGLSIFWKILANAKEVGVSSRGKKGRHGWG